MSFFIAIYIVFESIERFIEPKEIHSENLILISFIDLLVNIVGLVFAYDHGDDSNDHHHHHHEHQHNENNEIHDLNKWEEEKEHDHHEHKHSHEHKNENIYAIYIHILADTLGSVAVLISAFLIKYHKLYINDQICSLFISGMIIASIIPVLKNASMTLLHIPNKKLLKKRKKLSKV